MQQNVKKKILAISGSARRNSNNEKILNSIAEIYSKEIEVHIYNLLNQLPYFDPDLRDENVAPQVKDFRELIAHADGIIISTPEYVFSIPGLLKNALEWTVSTTVFSNKPVSFIVASSSGEKAFKSLDLIMSTLTQTPVPDNVKLLIRGLRAVVNEDGVIIDKNIIWQITHTVDNLIMQIENSKSVKNKIGGGEQGL
jgi:chromate reductase, NAD(P)H dehydrogenase (quinone)